MPVTCPAYTFGPLIFGGNVDQVDARTLTLLSSETGAKTYIVREVGDGAALRDACATISRELREQYTVGFVAPDAERGGYRSIHVDVPTHPEVHAAGAEGRECWRYRIGQRVALGSGRVVRP